MDRSRRTFAKNAIGAATAWSLSSLLNPARANEDDPAHIVCVGAHPDDPESGCGGTLALLSQLGHAVTIIYLTRGEAGIAGTSHKDAAAIRTREAEAACRILNARAVFAGQIDGDTVVNNPWVGTLQQLIMDHKPRIVFTHWPIDSHKDHQAASLLTIQTWMKHKDAFDLYFFEVCTGSQSMGFRPTVYADISTTQEQKRRAVYCHTSQNPDGIYRAADCNHARMEEFRGIEIGVSAAEAFASINTSIAYLAR